MGATVAAGMGAVNVAKINIDKSTTPKNAVIIALAVKYDVQQTAKNPNNKQGIQQILDNYLPGLDGATTVTPRQVMDDERFNAQLDRLGVPPRAVPESPTTITVAPGGIATPGGQALPSPPAPGSIATNPYEESVLGFNYKSLAIIGGITALAIVGYLIFGRKKSGGSQ